MKEYFDFVLNGFLILVEKTMIIGDSLHSDIQGGSTSENSNCLAQSDLRSSNTNHSTQLYDSTAR